MVSCVSCLKEIQDGEAYTDEASLGMDPDTYCASCWSDVKADNSRRATAALSRSPARDEFLDEIARNLAGGHGLLRAAEHLVRTNPIFYDRAGFWWCWNAASQSWTEADETDLAIIARKSLALIGDTTVRHYGRIIEALRQVAREHAPKELAPDWVQYGSTLVNVRTGEQMASTPDYFSTNPVPWELGQTTDTPTIDALFQSWVGDDAPVLYELLAYCIVRDYPIHRMFCFVGSGANGKSSFFKLVHRFVGTHNIASSSIERLSKNHFGTFSLYKKLVAFIGETTHHQIENTDLLKALTGQDQIVFETKGKPGFTGMNYAKIFIATNSLPTANDTSDGWYRRIHITRFPNKFPESGRDVIGEITDAEMCALAAKTCRLIPEILRRGGFTKEGTLEIRQQTYHELSNPLRTFLETYYSRDLNARSRYSEVYNEYLAFLASRKLRRISKKEFTATLEDEGLEMARTSLKDLSTGEFTTSQFILGLQKQPEQRIMQVIRVAHSFNVVKTALYEDMKSSHKPHNAHEQDFLTPADLLEVIRNAREGLSFSFLATLWPGEPVEHHLAELLRSGAILEAPAGHYRGVA